jgi:NAD(P)H-flavin reductase
MIMQVRELGPPPVCGLEAMMPVEARIATVNEENFNTRTFTLQILDEYARELFRFVPGQFNMLYVPGVGEAAISISSDATQPQKLEHTIRMVGSVTRAMMRLGEGGIIGLRGPFGRGWPLQQLEGSDVVIVGGGIGLAPLRPVIYHILRNRARFGRIVLLYGCRTPNDRLYADQLEQWTAHEKIDVLVTVDNATPGWVGPVGVVMKLLQRIKVNADRTSVLVCGPRILNRVAAYQFLQLHVPPEQVFVSLERNMHCGFGRCGHCQYGPKFICKDGPVFSFAEIADIFAKEEI